MKCYIRRYNEKENTWLDSWFCKHLWGTQNHWATFKGEAKQFESVKEARAFIKMYKLKNCEVEK